MTKRDKGQVNKVCLSLGTWSAASTSSRREKGFDAYPFPIHYEIAEAVDIQMLVWAEKKSPCLEPIKRAAKKLEKLGCRPHTMTKRSKSSSAATAFFQRHPNMGAMLLDCTGSQPFARALQREIDIPIFSWGTLLDYAYSVLVHRYYYGHT